MKSLNIYFVNKYFKIQASVCEHLGKIPQYKCQAAEFSGYKSGSLACINEIDLCIQCSVSAPHYDQFGQIMSKNWKSSFPYYMQTFIIYQHQHSWPNLQMNFQPNLQQA